MAPSKNKILRPSSCFCFPNSYQYNICDKIKWSTLSIGTALLIIIVYLSSGLYALIDATIIMSAKSNNSEDLLWPISSSSFMSTFGWISVSIYFTVVLLVTILLCGIQLKKSWILFIWVILMIFMILGDGVVTVLTLREYQQQNYRLQQQIKVLFFVMSVRLIVALCGIFINVFHFRHLNKIQSKQLDRQRMLYRYNSETLSSSLHGSYGHLGIVSDPSKDYSDDLRMSDVSPSVPLPRAQVGVIQPNSVSKSFHLNNQKSQFTTQSHQQIMNKQYNDDFRYNIPLHERFYQQKIHHTHEF